VPGGNPMRQKEMKNKKDVIYQHITLMQSIIMHYKQPPEHHQYRAYNDGKVMYFLLA
jgi:hypothetical protein